MTECPQIDQNIAATAALYSTLAGVLAGFVFAALLTMITTRLGVEKSREDLFADASRALISSIIVLIHASVGYAVLGGSTTPSGRAASQSSILNAALASAVVLMMYAIILTLDAVEAIPGRSTETGRDVARFIRRGLGQVGTPLIMFYTYAGIFSYTNIRYGKHHSFQPLELFGIVVVATQAVVGLGLYPLWSARAARRPTPPLQTVPTKILTDMFLVLNVSVGLTFAFIQGTLSVCSTVHPAIPGAVLGTTFLVMTATTYLLAISQPRASNSDPGRR